MNTLIRNIELYLVVGFVLFLLIVGAAVLLYLLSQKKSKSIAEINYDSFDRNDSLEYIKFDEVVSSSEEDLLKGAGAIVRNKNTFIAAVTVTGYNFYSAGYHEQENTIAAMISMMDTLENPIQIRQTSKAIDISYNIGVFEQIRDDYRNRVLLLAKEKQKYFDLAEDNIDDEELANVYLDQYEALGRQMEMVERQYDEAEEMIAYMTEISSASGDTQKVQNIIFSYDYDANQFTSQLSREEIVSQALSELDSRAASLIQSLIRCGCSARRCTAEELVDLMRRHTHPVTADETSVSDLLNTDLSALYVSSDTLLIQMENRLTDENYRLEQARLKREKELHESRVAEKLKRESLTAEKKERELLVKTEETARKRLHM